MIVGKIIVQIRTIAFGATLTTAFLAGIGTLGQTPIGQTRPQSPASAAALEFPVLLRQNVTAGKNPVGAKVHATLEVATLVNGVVVPQGAIFSGEVIESVAKSAADASRLAICMDSARWKNSVKANSKPSDKNKAAPTSLAFAPRVCLTAWYYPVVVPSTQDLASQQPDASQSNAPLGRHRGRNVPPSPFPPDDPSTVPLPTSDISRHRVQMKNIESARNPDGSITLTSKSFNIKVNKTTTYVLASGPLLAQ